MGTKKIKNVSTASLPENPENRTELYLDHIAGGNAVKPSEPHTRLEKYLDYIAENPASTVTQTTGTSITAVMSQKATTDELTALNNDIVELETDLATQTRINTKQSREIANLKQQAPADTVVNYPDTTYGKGEVPTSVCKYAEVNKINGCSRVWNQLMQGASDSNAGITVAFSDGKYTVNGTATSNASVKLTDYTNSYINGHKYACIFSCKNMTIAAGVAMLSYNGLDNLFADSIITCSSSTSNQSIRLVVYNGQTITNGELRVMCIDLTLLYGSGNEPTTVAQFKADYPLPYYAYNAGEIKSSTLTAFNSRGVNMCNGEVYELNTWTVANNVYSINNRAYNNLRFKSVKLYAGVTYIMSVEMISHSGGMLIMNISNLDFSIEKNVYMSSTGRKYDTYTPSVTDDYYLTFYQTTENQSSIKEPQIAVGTTATTYHPYNAHSTSLPQAITLKSAGNAKDEYVPSTGAVTRNIGMVDLGTLDWFFTSNDRFETKMSDFGYPISKAVAANVVPNIICSIYSSVSYNSVLNTNNTINIWIDGDYIEIHDSSVNGSREALKSKLNNVYLYYQLATPTSESVTPIDDFIEVEAEGEMSLTHTETPAMDSRFTVTYANLS